MTNAHAVFCILLYLVYIQCRPLVETPADSHTNLLFPHDEKNDTTQKRYFGFTPGFSYHGGGGGSHTDGHGHLGDINPIAGHEGFHASQHPHHDEHHDDHHDDHHHAPAYGHAGSDGDEYGGDGIDHHHDSEPNTMMGHKGPGVHFHTGMIHMDEGGHLSRSGNEEGNMFNGIDSVGAHGGHGDSHEGGGEEEEEHHHHEEPHEEEHEDRSQMMQIPIAPLPHGYHQGLGPNGESEDHDDEEEEIQHAEKDHRQHEYNMDRGGPDEHHMLAGDEGHHNVHQGFRHLHARHAHHHGPVHEEHHHRDHFHEHEYSGDMEEPHMDHMDDLEWDEDEFMDKKKAAAMGGGGAKAHGGGEKGGGETKTHDKAKAHAAVKGGGKAHAGGGKAKGHGAIIKSNGAVVAGKGGVKVHLAAGHIGTIASPAISCAKLKGAAAAACKKKAKAAEKSAAESKGKSKEVAKSKEDLKKEIAEAVAKETKRLKAEAAAKEKDRIKAIEEAAKLKELANQERIKKLEQQYTETTEAMKEVAAKVQGEKGKAVATASSDSSDSKKQSNSSVEAPGNATLPGTNVKITVDNSREHEKPSQSEQTVEFQQKDPAKDMQLHEPEIAVHNQDLLDPNPPSPQMNDARVGNNDQPVMPQEHPPNNNQNNDHGSLPFPNSQEGLPPVTQPHFQGNQPDVTPMEAEQREHNAQLPSQDNMNNSPSMMDNQDKSFSNNLPNDGRNFENENHFNNHDNHFYDNQSDKNQQNFNGNSDDNNFIDNNRHLNDGDVNDNNFHGNVDNTHGNVDNTHGNIDNVHGNTNDNGNFNDHIHDNFHDNINNNDNQNFHNNNDNHNDNFEPIGNNNDGHFHDNNLNENNNNRFENRNNLNRGGNDVHSTDNQPFHDSNSNRNYESGIENGPLGDSNRHQMRDKPANLNSDHGNNFNDENLHKSVDSNHGNDNYHREHSENSRVSHGDENNSRVSHSDENNSRVSHSDENYHGTPMHETVNKDDSHDLNRDLGNENPHFNPPTNPRPSPAQVQQQIPEKDHLHGETNRNIHISFSEGHGNTEESRNAPYTEEVGLQNSNDPILKKIREELKSGGNDMSGGGKMNEGGGMNGKSSNSESQDKNQQNPHSGAGTMQDLEALMPGNDQNQILHKSFHPCVECRHEEKAKTRHDVRNAKPDYDLIFVKMKTDQNKPFNNNYLRRRDKIVSLKSRLS